MPWGEIGLHGLGLVLYPGLLAGSALVVPDLQKTTSDSSRIVSFL